jgi:hypothetical protein
LDKSELTFLIREAKNKHKGLMLRKKRRKKKMDEEEEEEDK